MNVDADSPIEFTKSPQPRVFVVGKRVMVAIDQTITYLTPGEAADMQALLQRSEADARANALRGAP